MNRTLLAGAAVVALAGHAAGARAADTLAARVDVVDDGGAQLANADVSALRAGALIPLGRTDATGELAVTVDAGDLIVARRGVRSSQPAAVRGGRVRVVIPIAKIGYVHARSERPEERTITQASESAIAFDDLALARTLLPNYRSSAEGGSGRQMLNGVPLDLPSGPRGSSDDPGVPGDLIDSFSATQADDGTVTPNYHLLAPTQQPALRFTSGLGAFDGSLWKAGLSGTTHGLGFALTGVTGRDDGPLAGATLADASGERYDHSTNARHTDVSLALSHSIGSTQINAAGFATRKRSDDIDPTLAGDVLAGIGAGNVTTKTTAFGYVIATQTHGRDALHVLDSRFAGGSADDAQDAVVAGSAAGYTSGYRYSGHYDEAAFTRSFGSSSLTFKTTLTSVATTGYITTPGFAAQTPSVAGQSTAGVDFEQRSGRHAFGLEVDGVDRSGLFSGSDLEARAHVRTTLAGTTLALSATHGQAQTQEAYSAGAYDFSAPSAAALTCGVPSATVTGPAGALGRHPEADTVDVHVERELPNHATLSAGGFVSYGRNSLVFPAAQLGASLDPAYRTQIESNYARLCPGRSLAANDIYTQRYETVPRLIGREWFIDAALPIGPFRTEATYETYSLVAPQIPADLAGVQSTLVAGTQIPGVPLHRANLLLSYRRGRLVLASALQYVSANNSYNLPGRVTVTAGAQIPLGRGTLALSAQNLFHAYAGTYISSRYAVPLATTTGSLPTLAVPLRPVWSLRYSIPIGPTTSLHH